jgi:hypothetical protein
MWTSLRLSPFADRELLDINLSALHRCRSRGLGNAAILIPRVPDASHRLVSRDANLAEGTFTMTRGAKPGVHQTAKARVASIDARRRQADARAGEV